LGPAWEQELLAQAVLLLAPASGLVSGWMQAQQGLSAVQEAALHWMAQIALAVMLAQRTLSRAAGSAHRQALARVLGHAAGLAQKLALALTRVKQKVALVQWWAAQQMPWLFEQAAPTQQALAQMQLSSRAQMKLHFPGHHSRQWWSQV
jgi:hypothetical protein